MQVIPDLGQLYYCAITYLLTKYQFTIAVCISDQQVNLRPFKKLEGLFQAMAP